jgi:hypothetical protein
MNSGAGCYHYSPIIGGGATGAGPVVFVLCNLRQSASVIILLILIFRYADFRYTRHTLLVKRCELERFYG